MLLVMRRRNYSGLLLRPSLLSSIVCGSFAVGVILASNWSNVLKNLSFYNYFFGKDGLVTTLQNTKGSGSAISQALTSKSLAHNATILLGAIAVGIAGYVIIRLIIKLISSASMTIKEMQAVDTPAKRVVERELEQRVMIRLLVAVAWTAYLFIYIKVILPFCILASEVGFDQKSMLSEAIGYLLFAFVLLFLASHLQVIIMRLFLLKVRVFGNPDIDY
jgi:hypothetical protein